MRRLITVPEARDWIALEYSDQDLEFELAMISSDDIVLNRSEDRTYDSNSPRCDASRKYVDRNSDIPSENSSVESQDRIFCQAEDQCVQYLAGKEVLEKLGHKFRAKDPKMQSKALSGPFRLSISIRGNGTGSLLTNNRASKKTERHDLR